MWVKLPMNEIPTSDLDATTRLINLYTLSIFRHESDDSMVPSTYASIHKQMIWHAKNFRVN